MNKLEDMKLYHEASYYGCSDIAEKLIQLAELEDDGELGKELLDALYQIQAMAQNPYNSDYYRVLFNTLLAVAGKE